jgi:hypothetical protein
MTAMTRDDVCDKKIYIGETQNFLVTGEQISRLYIPPISIRPIDRDFFILQVLVLINN